MPLWLGLATDPNAPVSRSPYTRCRVLDEFLLKLNPRPVRSLLSQALLKRPPSVCSLLPAPRYSSEEPGQLLGLLLPSPPCILQLSLPFPLLVVKNILDALCFCELSVCTRYVLTADSM